MDKKSYNKKRKTKILSQDSEEEMKIELKDIKAKSRKKESHTLKKSNEIEKSLEINETQQKNNELSTENKKNISKSEKKSLENLTSKKESKQTKLNAFLKIEKSKDPEFPSLPINLELRIYSWNVNGIRAIMNKNDFQNFVNEENPDIFCLNETKIDDDTLTELKYDKLFKEKYLSYWNCGDKKGYSGVAVFTKYLPLSVTKGINVKKHDDEGRVITLEFEKFYLVCTYIPNAGQKLDRLKYRTQEWDLDFRDYLQNLRSKKNIIWIGDINVAHKEIDLTNPKTNQKTAGFTKEERQEFTKTIELGYVDTFRHLYPEEVKYSWWSYKTNGRAKNVGWRLDYAVINKEALENLVNSEILNKFEGSDHCPVKLTFLNK